MAGGLGEERTQSWESLPEGLSSPRGHTMSSWGNDVLTGTQVTDKRTGKSLSEFPVVVVLNGCTHVDTIPIFSQLSGAEIRELKSSCELQERGCSGVYFTDLHPWQAMTPDLSSASMKFFTPLYSGLFLYPSWLPLPPSQWHTMAFKVLSDNPE